MVLWDQLYPRKPVYSGNQGINSRNANGPVLFGLKCHTWFYMFGWHNSVEYASPISRDPQKYVKEASDNESEEIWPLFKF